METEETPALKARKRTEQNIEKIKASFLNVCRNFIEASVQDGKFRTDVKSDYDYALQHAYDVLTKEGFKINKTYGALYISW